MTGIVCIDPSLDNSTCSFGVEKEDNSLSHHITNTKDPKQWAWLFEASCICYDLMRVLDYGFGYIPVIDIKILYELKGHKFENIAELGQMILGESFVEKYNNLSAKIKAHLTSYRLAKINTSLYGESELIPDALYRNFYEERSKLILALYSYYIDQDLDETDRFYHSLYESAVILHDISKSPIDIDLKALDSKVGHHVKTVKKYTVDGKANLHFHVVGAKTGRLAFKKGTINIYSFPKDLRTCIVAPPDCSIVEFDFKSFQPRLAICNTLDEEFKTKFRDIRDIYSVFPGDRQKNKIGFLAWMYSNNKDEMFEREAYPICTLRDELYIQARNTGKVVNRFGRAIYWQGDEKNVVFQNYVTSNEVDAILLVMKKVYERLKGRQSRIMFPFHDAIVCSIHKSEEYLVNEIGNIMEKTLYSTFNSYFPVEVKMGKNYGEMNDT
jgi:hypothetical protein